MKTRTVPAGAPSVTDLKWLVPRQCKHPSKLAFVIELDDVSCWPAGVTRHRFQLSDRTWLQIEQCTGSGAHAYDPNLDGLALIVERVDGAGKVVERMLLPGDAPYAYIPSCKKKGLDKVVALLAFHHGSETHLGRAKASIPAATGKAPRIVYTYGLKPNGERCFGHPSSKAIAEYKRRGWDQPEHPSGTFVPWPPEPGDRGDPAQRADALLTFTAPDAAVHHPPHPPAAAPVIAMHRR